MANINGTNAHEVLYGNAFENDVIRGFGGDDYIQTFSGGDFVDGGDGNDTLILQEGDDVGLGGNGKDFINTGAGNNIARGGQDGDYIFTDDYFSTNTFYGDEGDDAIKDGGGASLLVGGQGSDAMWGGDGADYFVFAAADMKSGTDKIYDWHTGGGQDKLNFQGFVPTNTEFGDWNGDGLTDTHITTTAGPDGTGLGGDIFVYSHSGMASIVTSADWVLS
jgi:Ca2+-binding RTX toxin-like protein